MFSHQRIPQFLLPNHLEHYLLVLYHHTCFNIMLQQVSIFSSSFHRSFENYFSCLDEAGPPHVLLPYQPGPPSHYLEQIRSDRKMLEEVCQNDFALITFLMIFLCSKKKVIPMHLFMAIGQLKMPKDVFINIYKKIIFHKNINIHQVDQIIFGLFNFFTDEKREK